jgi:hypothetical protein
MDRRTFLSSLAGGLVTANQLSAEDRTAIPPDWLQVPSALTLAGTPEKVDGYVYRRQSGLPMQEIIAAYETQWTAAKIKPKVRFNGMGWSMEGVSGGYVAQVKFTESDGKTQISATWVKSAFSGTPAVSPTVARSYVSDPKASGTKRSSWPKWFPRVQTLNGWEKRDTFDPEGWMRGTISLTPQEALGFYRRAFAKAGFSVPAAVYDYKTVMFTGTKDISGGSLKFQGIDPDNGRSISIIVDLNRSTPRLDEPYLITLQYWYLY